MEDYITKDREIRRNNPDRWSHYSIIKLLEHYLNTKYNDETAVVLEKLLVFPEDKELREKIIKLLHQMAEESKGATEGKNSMYEKYANKIGKLIEEDLNLN